MKIINNTPVRMAVDLTELRTLKGPFYVQTTLGDEVWVRVVKKDLIDSLMGEYYSTAQFDVLDTGTTVYIFGYIG